MLLPLLLTLLAPAAVAAPEEPPTAQAVEIVPPSVQDFVEPAYPEGAKLQGLEARVLLEIAISETGAVLDAAVVEPVGNGFDEAALEAARQLTFTPAQGPDGPLAVTIQFAYGFELAEEEAPAAINLELRLQDRATRAPLPDLPIRVTAADGTVFSATSDANGAAALRGVPSGAARILVGAEDLKLAEESVTVLDGEVTAATLWVQTSVRDDELLVIGTREQIDVTRRTLTVEEIKRVPGTFGDPVRVIQNLPGAARAPFGTGLLVIRGANPEDSNVYIDGVNVPIIYHLGGYRSVINADLIQSVDYLPGGYGVRYGQSTGGVIDVRTKDTLPDQPQLTIKSDLLDTGVHFQTPIGDHDAVEFAARRSYIDAFLPIFNANSGGFFILPRWFDYQARWLRRKGPDTISVFLFGYGDLLFVSTPDDFTQGTDPDTQGDISTRYGAHRLVFRWTHEFSDELRFVFQPFLGLDDVAFGLGTTLGIEQSFQTIGLRSSLPWSPSEALTVTPGVDMQFARYEVNLNFPFSITTDTDPLGEREAFSDTLKGSGAIPDPYLDVRWKPFSDRDRLMLNPGVRFSSLSANDFGFLWAVDPRLIARLRVWEGGYLKGGTGLYQQPPENQELGIDESPLVFERAWATEAGFEQALGQAITADVTFFSKDLDRLVVQNPDFDDESDPFYTNGGVGRIRGVEILARHAPVGDFFGWVSYTLSKSERNDRPGREDAEWYLFNFDQTHILTVVAGYDLPWDIGVSSRFQHVSGNPYTPYAGAIYDLDQDSYIGFQSGDFNSERLAPYTALDLRVDKTWTFKGWTLETYADMLNVIRGENPEQLQYNYDFTENTTVRGLPFIPSVGLQADIYF